MGEGLFDESWWARFLVGPVLLVGAMVLMGALVLVAMVVLVSVMVLVAAGVLVATTVLGAATVLMLGRRYLSPGDFKTGCPCLLLGGSDSPPTASWG